MAYTVVRRPLVAPNSAKVGPAGATVVMPLTWVDVEDIKYNPEYSLYTIPFGPARGMVVVRRLSRLTWKMTGKKAVEAGLIKEPKFWEMMKKYIANGDKRGNVARGLVKAIAISKSYAGTKGIVVINGIPYPRKAIEQRRWKEEKRSEIETKASELERVYLR